ncbi:MAG: insulinase family protein, partial [Saprospiraceae bacterium]|nr:insulinase family protein [Saprospiraceae bacterium]
KDHPDENALELCNNLLSNSASTGLFDKLYMDNKIMGAGMSLYQFTDIGGTLVFFVPKIFGQSLKNAEKLVISEIEKIKNGEFSEEQLEAIKINLKKYHEESLENMYRRPFLMIDAFMQNKNWDEILSYPNQIDKITKSDVIKAANKYYGKDYLALYSKMGIPKKKKIKKPDYKPIEPKNAESKSEFAASLEDIKEIKVAPKFIEFDKDVMVDELKENCVLYYTENPVNNIFKLNIKYGVGTHEIPILEQASSYLNHIGCVEYNFNELNKKLQSIGSSFSAYSTKDYFIINISGFDNYFQKTLTIISELLVNMQADDSQLKKLVQEAKMNKKMENKDPATVGSALMNYALYKDQSPFINRLSVKEVKNLQSDSLIAALKKAMKYEAEVHYSGKLPLSSVKKILLSDFYFSDKLQATKSPITYKRETVKENTIYIVDNKKAIQSHIYCIIEGEQLDQRQRSIASAFNKYFGDDMSSIIFQEIREYKALAYSAYGYYINPFRMDETGYTMMSMSTQADKTTEAISTLNKIITDLPVKEDRITTIKSSMLQSINSSRPTFRSMSYSVARWKRMGYQYDPRKDSYSIYENLEFDDIYSFYKKNIQNKPIIMTIVGDKERINIEELKKFGKIIFVKSDDVFSD